MSKVVKIAPSLLAADFSNLAGEIERVERAGCDLLHIDVMDGHFVPNLTVGPFIVKAIRKITKLSLDVHLMIEHPGEYINPFADAGADSITFHAEVAEDMGAVIGKIRARKLSVGVSLKPATPIERLTGILSGVDLVLLMTVNPGFGGQQFMREVLPKITALRKNFTGDIQVDGGINKDTGRDTVRAGANVLVAGTAIFGRTDIKQAIEELRCPS